MSDHEEFFKRTTHIQIVNFMANQGCTIEELYQAFRARLFNEVEADIKGRMAEFLGVSDTDEE